MLDDGSPPGPAGYLNFKAVLQARAAAQRHDLHHSLRHLLEVIAGFTNGAPAWPSYEALADATGLKPDAVRKQAKALVDQGYLTRTRRPRPNGGWGQPEWALGPTCHQVGVGSPSHSPQVQVGSPSQSSGITVPLASGITVPQKRRLSTTVVQPPLVGVVEGGSEERREEKDPPPPQPTKQQKVAAVVDAIKDAGLKAPHVSGRDAGAINGCDAPPEEIAEAWRRFAVGEWPPPSAAPRDRAFANGNRALWFVIDRLNAILADGPPNGRPPMSPATRAQIERHRKEMLADEPPVLRRPAGPPGPR